MEAKRRVKLSCPLREGSAEKRLSPAQALCDRVPVQKGRACGRHESALMRQERLQRFPKRLVDVAGQGQMAQLLHHERTRGLGVFQEQCHESYAA
jgi:DNA repair ATPase RecN